MSWWSGFTDTISRNVVNPTKGFFSGLVNNELEPTIAKADPATEGQLKATLQNALRGVQDFGITGAERTTDLLLAGATALNNKVISPYMTRPVSTLALLTDASSPLYKQGQYEKGFQLSDIKAAYDRSEKVSMGQAFTKSDLIPFAKPVSQLVLGFGNININDVNLWDDENIQKNFVDNTVGKWFTGAIDFTVGNIAVGKGFGVIGKLSKVGLKSAGVIAKEKSVAQLNQDINAGLDYANNVPGGRQTVSASHMMAIAETQELGKIDDIVQIYSNNERLTPILANVKDPAIVRDIILGDKGDVQALSRLAETNADDLFEMGDVAQKIKVDYIKTGNIFNPEGPAVERLSKAFDQAVSKDARMTKLRDAFFDDSDQLRILGKLDYFPAEPRIGTGAYIKAETALREGKALARTGELKGKGFLGADFGRLGANEMGEILSLKVGSRVGAPTVNFIKFSNTVSKLKPLRFVTFSGMRPGDGRIELNAFLDSIPTFKDGNAQVRVTPSEFKKVSDLRNELEDSYLKAITPEERFNALSKIDETIGKVIGYNNGHYNETAINAQVQQMLSNTRTNKRVFEKNGYSFNADGTMNRTDIQTTSQMAESYLFTPWDIIEKQFNDIYKTGVSRGAVVAKNQASRYYESLTRLWSFNALARPMFIPKNSLFEPMVSSYLLLGGKTTGSIAKSVTNNAVKNTNNWVRQNVANKVVNRADIKAINKTVVEKQKNISLLQAMRDEYSTGLDDLLSGKVSPAAKEQNFKKLSKTLKSVNKALDDAEADLIDMTASYGALKEAANAPSLERRIVYIEKTATPATLKKIKPQIDAAKSGLSTYKTLISKMATNGKIIKEAEAKLTKTYDDIDNAIAQSSELSVEQATVFGRSKEFKKRYYGKKDNYRMFNGQYVKIPSFFDDVNGNNFSKAVRAEVDNTITAEQTILGELSIGARSEVIASKVPNMPIDITSPIYYNQLEYVANRLIRNDNLVKVILSNPSTATLKKWATSQEGRLYVKQFGIYDDADAIAKVKDQYAFINRTIPSKEAQAILLQREIKATELQELLAPALKEDRLFPIAPADWGYAEEAMFGANKAAAVDSFFDKFTKNVFRTLNKPENPIRESVFDEVAMTKLTEKAQALVSQGVDVKISGSQWNALKQAASREALQEVEKTFYTVRRQNNVLYALRGVMAFPNAAFNAVYRYGRLAANNPTRALGFTYNYGRTFSSFAVDKNGNPTEDINKMAYLVLPGSKELGLGDGGVQLNAKSLGFLLNAPSPSFITSISTAKVFENWPTAEDYASGKKGPEQFRKLFGWAYAGAYPYGPQDVAYKSFIPSWMNSAYNAFMSPMGKQDYLSSVNSIYRYHKILFDMGIEKTPMSEEQAIKEARGLWLLKALGSFVSPAGVPTKVNTNPSSLIDNLYTNLVSKYQKQGSTREEAKTLAGDELLATVGPDLVLENVTFKDYNKNIPGLIPTVEGYSRIFKDNNDLVKQLAQIKDGDVSLVGLLGADIEYKIEDRNLAVSKIFNDPNLKLPGTSKLVNDIKLTPAEEDTQRQKSILWDRYNSVKEALAAKITDGKSLRSHPEMQAYLSYLAETAFKGESQAWYDEYAAGVRGDNSYNYARGLNTIITNKDFMGKHGTTEYWQDVKTFMNLRNKVASLYNSFPDGDFRKSKFKEAYLAYLDMNISSFHPKLQTMIKIYFDNDTLKVVE
jgi:hypothetical protein